MDKRWSVLLLVALCAALVGLLSLQVVWFSRTIALRGSQYEQSVDNALFAVSDRLELQERIGRLRRHAGGQQLIQHLDSLHAQPAPGLLDLGSTTGLTDADHEALVTDVVRDILRSSAESDPRDRIDADLLDSLLNAEFIAMDLPAPTAYGVFTNVGEPLLLGGHEPAVPMLQPSPYKERLFRHDISGLPVFLHVSMPDQRDIVLRGTGIMLFAAVLFTLIIILAFIYTLRTIRRQKQLSEIRTDLVNNLTHELKTPISTIGLACEALSDPSMPKTEDQVRTYVSMIREENKRLGALVENVLQSAVLLQGRMLLKPVELDMHKLVEEVVRGSSIRVAKGNGRIGTRLDAEIHVVMGDRIHLTNLLYNLVDNAVKYTATEPRITIATSSNTEGMTISVTDNGVGIPASEQRKIFERLYRIPTGNVHNAKGFGLGLSYVRTVVERHGGHIRLDSAPGKGSTFHIFLPFEHVASQEAIGGRG
ncbi:MAG: HAMP domain-containing histidine kinase [Flavobacteriales bacterium]|nr:HAMP domain-containing histidine kinase [Flavobacteriales bacterium]